MKPRFISKTERQLLKAVKEKQTEQVNQGSSEQAADKKVSIPTQPVANGRNGKSKQTHQPTRNRDGDKQHNNATLWRNQTGPHKVVPVERYDEESPGSPRERSRDLTHRNIISREEEKERVQFKQQYLGLVKQSKSSRHELSYRNALKFQWDNSQDTSGGYLSKALSDALKSQQAQDQLVKERTKNWKNKQLEQMTERDWRIFREDNQIYIKGGRVPNPFREWSQLQGLNNKLQNNLLKMKFFKPKPIQMQAIPIGLEGRDMMAIAPTGQGKTLAYLIPIFQFVMPLERCRGLNCDKGPYALVLVPSRELAEQIEVQYLKISSELQLSVFTAIGGHQIELQSISLSKGCELLIGTPGRVKELLEKGYLSLERLTWVVIDEADKMISENLVEEVQYILENSGSSSLLERGGGMTVHLSASSQSARRKVLHMFSATMVPQIEKLSKNYLAHGSCYLTIGEPGGGKKQIEQHIELIDEGSKSDRLGRILKNLPGPIIVFANTREKCEKLAIRIEQRWNRTVCDYHGGKNQEQRERIISQFRSGKIEILMATDLAGRGLDVKGVSAIINYDAPKNISEFIHRCGRTGRAGMKGVAYTLLTGEDEALFYDLRVFMERNGFSVPEDLKAHPSAFKKPGAPESVPRRNQIVYTN